MTSLYLDLAAAMTPLDTILAVAGLVGFLLAVIAFLALIWKISWTLRGWIVTEETRAKNEEQVVAVVKEFVVAQREANQSFSASQQSITNRLGEMENENRTLHRAIVALNRKWRFNEGEEAGAESEANIA